MPTEDSANRAASGEYLPSTWNCGTWLDRFVQLFVAHAIAELAGVGLQQRVADQRFEQLILHAGLQLRRQLAAEALLPHRLLALPLHRWRPWY